MPKETDEEKLERWKKAARDAAMPPEIAKMLGISQEEALDGMKPQRQEPKKQSRPPPEKKRPDPPPTPQPAPVENDLSR